MKTMLNMIIILIISLIHLNNTKIIFIFEVFRHGARSPLVITNNKDLINRKWNIKDGELTKLGMRQHEILGSILRKKIDENNLLSKVYKNSEIEVYSTNFNRTINSAYSQLRGLYTFNNYSQELNKFEEKNSFPPNKLDQNSKDLLINQLGTSPLPDNLIPIPLKVVEIGDSTYDLEGICYNKTTHDINQNLETRKAKINKILKNFKESKNQLISAGINSIFFEYTYKDFQDFSNLCDAFISDEFELKDLAYLGVNLTELNETMKECSGLNLDVMSGNKISKMMQSNLMRKIIDSMDSKLSDPQNSKNVILSSSHDLNLMQIFYVLNEAFGINPPDTIFFASNMLFELHEDKIIKIIYNDVEIFADKYDVFKKKLLSVLSSEQAINEYCQIDNSLVNKAFISDRTILIVIICCLSVALVVLVYIFIKNLRKSRKVNAFLEQN